MWFKFQLRTKGETAFKDVFNITANKFFLKYVLIISWKNHRNAVKFKAHTEKDQNVIILNVSIVK